VPYFLPKSIGINSQRLAKYLELSFTVKLLHFWSTSFEPYDGVQAKYLPHIGGFNMAYIMAKLIGINSQ